MIFRTRWRNLFGLIEPIQGFAAAANAHGPVRRVAIQQAERALRPGLVQTAVQTRRRFEFAFHLPDKP